MNRQLELLWKMNWHLKVNNYTTEELKYVIEHLQELVRCSEWDGDALSNILDDVQSPNMGIID